MNKTKTLCIFIKFKRLFKFKPKDSSTGDSDKSKFATSNLTIIVLEALTNELRKGKRNYNIKLGKIDNSVSCE